jgi:histidinol phosphatase-like PHP family hydrolase
VKIDLHVHTKERSPCAKDSDEEMIRAAIDRGLDGLAFTDHGRLVPRQRLSELDEQYAPFCVFGGIELSISGEDLLVLGLDDSVLEEYEWTYPELHAFVLGQGGYLVLAHPFRFRDTVDVDIETYPPDAIELHSMNIRASDEGRICALAERLNLRLLCNSDAHRALDIGRFFNVLPRAPQDSAGLVEILQVDDFQCDSVD